MGFFPPRLSNIHIAQIQEEERRKDIKLLSKHQIQTFHLHVYTVQSLQIQIGFLTFPGS